MAIPSQALQMVSLTPKLTAREILSLKLNMVHLDSVCLSLECLEDFNKQTYTIKYKKSWLFDCAGIGAVKFDTFWAD